MLLARYYYLHITVQETEAQKGSDLTKDTINAKAKVETMYVNLNLRFILLLPPYSLSWASKHEFSGRS